jgi:hypothetical protein
MDRSGHLAGCLLAATSFPGNVFRKRLLLRWMNFKMKINQEKPSKPTLCIAKSETMA